MKSIRFYSLLCLHCLIPGLLLCSGFISPLLPVYAATAVRFVEVPLPSAGDEGGWCLAPGSDIVKVAAAENGRLYAAVSGLAESLFVSEDNGLTWRATGDVHQEIIDIAVSPGSPETIVYATGMRVYQSADGGETFFPLPSTPGQAGTGNRTIVSLDVTVLDKAIITVGVKDNDPGESGGIYLFDEHDLGPAWEDTGLTGYDILDVNFSPGYHADRCLITAVTDEENSYIMFQRAGTGWNDTIGAAEFYNNDAPLRAIAAQTACLAFPDDFFADPSGENCLFYAGVNTGDGYGDVYRIECAADGSPATDLDVGLEGGLPNVDIASLTAAGTNPFSLLMAGGASGTDVYVSRDNGSTWGHSRKSPAGSTVTSVLFQTAEDRYFSATSGNGSGVAFSLDGQTWNQAGLIDTTLDTIVDFVPSPAYGSDATMYLLTWGNGSSLWRSTTGGAAWERVLWPGIAGITECNMVSLPPGYGSGSDTVFCTGQADGVPGILVSSDRGQNYRFKPAFDPETGASITIDAWAVVSEDTFFIAGYNEATAMVYRTDNAGFFYLPGIKGGEVPFTSLSLSPDFANDGSMTAGTMIGDVYLYQGSGRFHKVTGQHGSPFDGRVYPIFDTNYSDNSYIYAAGASSGDGIKRFKMTTGTEWESIDATYPDDSQLDRLLVTDEGTLYASNMIADGGMERCLDPRAMTNEFDTMTRGLEDNSSLFGLWSSGNHIWTTDASARLLRFDDIMTGPVFPSSPKAQTSGYGNIIDHTIRNIDLDWETMPGATEYEWQCDDDADFIDIASDLKGKTEASSISLPALEPGTTYYWRVRACSPVNSRWSDILQFTTALDTEEIVLRPVSPAPGAIDVPAQPLFQWTAVQSATAYELLVARDINFAAPSVAMTGDHRLPVNVWQCDVELEAGVTYYWKVRACTPGTFSSWSSTGIFSTILRAGSDLEPEGMIASLAPAAPVSPTGTSVMPPVITQPVQTVIAPSISLNFPQWFLYGTGAFFISVTLILLGILVAILKRRSK